MASEHGLSLSYPNPSFSQMACLDPEQDDRGRQSKEVVGPPGQDGSSPIGGIRQVVIIASYASHRGACSMAQHF